MKHLELIVIFLHAMLLLCQQAEPASPRAVAVVTVAVAVDELLQTNTPDLPDELGGGRENVQPQPLPVNDVCQCGCGKIGCKCGKAAGVGCAAVLSVDDAALNALAPKSKERLIVYRMRNCPSCDRMERDGHGDVDVAIEYAGKEAPFAVNAYPIIFNPRTNQYLIGYASIQQIRVWLKLPAVKASQVSQAIGAVTVGTINGDAIRSILSQVKVSKAGGVIQVGGASLTVPAKMPTEVELTPDKMAVRFTSTKPRLAYGSGWLAVSQAVGHITVTRDLLTIGLDGFPDLCLRVE